MTLEERKNPRLLDRSRKLRISKGSGTTVNQINMLVSQLQMMNRMLNQQAAMAMPQMGASLEQKDGAEDRRDASSKAEGITKAPEAKTPQIAIRGASVSRSPSIKRKRHRYH